MLRVSRLTDYAAVVMTCLAAQPAEVLSAVQIAECTRLELPTVSKLMKLLGHAALVESFRGVNGGYRLARAPDDISLAQIVEAIEGPLGVTECSVGVGQCDRESYCTMRDNWQSINAAVDDALRARSLADVLKPVRKPAAMTATHVVHVQPLR
jgi:FeS assembly SUF system regulator